jgi:type I restriction-modification system DNA methylase subunit
VDLKKFDIFLKNLGFSEKDFSEKDKNIYAYKTNLYHNIYYTYTPTREDIFKKHQYFWNKNNVNAFIAVGENKSYIIHSKQKPNFDNPTAKNIVIKPFDYGVNTEGFEKEKVTEITKDYIDSAYFFDFVTKQTANKKRNEVDKDLLLNLITLRNDLLAIRNDEETIHLLILRSLFFKYLEDKGIYERGYWVNVLETNDPHKVLTAFNEIRKINGDIFDKQLPEDKIDPNYLIKLLSFFTSDYRTGQQSLFPYLFDQIPIQLISLVYEAFLRSKEKKGRGIYYTPSFVVNFMLSHSLNEKLKNKPATTILDPAVGSGAFLVESFRAIMQAQPQLEALPQHERFEKKKETLKNQLFGIDIDREALQIAAFSLYLALIETEEPNFIRKQIKNAYPILPSLIDNTLICANAITDEVFSDKTFDCIVSNPPWGSVEPKGDKENKKEREAIRPKGKIGTMPEYKHVSDYERSQAFLIRVKKWSHENTILSLIVKNSIFLNNNAEDFRKELLKTYQINYFYELSNFNKILFEKQKIGEINGKPIEIGATEPCAILVFETPKNKNNSIKYISPKLNGFSESFQLIHYTQKDINHIEQRHFIEDDLLWSVFVNGDFEDYNLIIRNRTLKNKLKVECRSGFQPQKNMRKLGEPDLRDLIEPNNFKNYRIISKLSKFNWNQKLRRKNEEIFFGKRIIYPKRPLKSYEYKLNCIRLSDEKIIHKENITCLRLLDKNKYIKNYKPYLAIANSKLLGYHLYHTAPQWDKGAEKRESIRNTDAESLPFIKINDSIIFNQLDNFVKIIENSHLNTNLKEIKNQIDELVFDLYNLSTYQKEIIREFYQVRVERASSKLKYVQPKDIEKYAEKFAEVFNDMLEEGKVLKALYKISQNLGAIVCFTIVDEENSSKVEQNNQYEIFHFIKKKQIQHAEISKILNEDKVKIYDNEYLYIIKSNLFKDWTIRQAIKDAKEEIGLLLSKLPNRHE